MKYIDLTFRDAERNLACDEALLDACEEAGELELLRVWEPRQPFVVLGYGNKVATEVNLTACQSRQVPVLRRTSGGGTVLQGAGCLNYSVLLRLGKGGPLQSVTGTNRFVLAQNKLAIEEAAVRHGGVAPLPLQVLGTSDLALGGLKFSGNAQRRKRTHLLFHGTFLLQFDLALIEQLLPLPSLQPDYRAGRAHRDFLTNLNLPADAVKLALRRVWHAEEIFAETPWARIEALATGKYATPEWNLKF